GTYDPVLGMSYVQIAREGLGYQKSQTGGGMIPKAGAVSTPYHRFGSVSAAEEKEKSFFDGIDVSLVGIATLAKSSNQDFLVSGLRQINDLVETAMTTFSADHPEKLAAQLALGYKETEKLIEQVRGSNLSADEKYNVTFELETKKAQFNNALSEALGLSVSVVMAPDTEPNPLWAMFVGDPDTTRVIIPDQKFGVKVHVVSQSALPVTLSHIEIKAADGKNWSISGSAAEQALQRDKPVDARFDLTAPKDVTFTQPYFSRPNIEQSYYDISDEKYLNHPLSPYPLAAWAQFSYEGVPIRVAEVVQSIKRVNGFGVVSEPLVVGPAVAIAINPKAAIVPLSGKDFSVTTAIRSNVKGAAKGSVKLDLPAGWKSSPASADFSSVSDGDEQFITFHVTPANLAEKSYQLTAVVEYGGEQYKQGYEVTGYPGLRPDYLYRPAVLRVSGVDVKVAEGLTVGYITGSGDDVPASLENLGVHVTFLTPTDVATADLSRYSAILLGVRAYAARDELKTYNSRLLNYVKNGGVMIVQYNTPEFDHNFGPYPYEMGSNPEEVTDEASKIDILNPKNPVFLWPNQITARDFEGWVEERGSKFLKSWDAQYESLLSTQDEGQESQKGGLLYAKYGKGVYIYNAYAFYRQLPEGVPGAFRIFANLISLPKNPNVK
ncbi:MAG: NEW3 domain-containing protein, partial [Candidatus Acidiferrum sp.]